MQISNLEQLKDLLLMLYNATGNERVGFIKGENNIIEVPNVADKPMEGFRVCGDVIIKHAEEYQCWATWHTHPGEDCNLSGEDYYSFMDWPDLVHFIIGNDGVKAFKWNEDKKAIVELE